MERDAFRYMYLAKPLSYIDGNTFNAEIDLGMGIKATKQCRLVGTKQAAVSPASSDPGPSEWVQALADAMDTQDGKIILRIIDDRAHQWHRPLVVVWADGRCVNKQLIQDGVLLPFSDNFEGFVNPY